MSRAPGALLLSGLLAVGLASKALAAEASGCVACHLGETKHEKARRTGAIPGSISPPLGALIMMDNGVLKPPAELLWMLRTRGITPNKTVITTCDTGMSAADAFFLLRYLGFPDVRVHEEAWVGWSKTR